MGFKTKNEALSFEWHMHHKKPRTKYVGSLENRIACVKAITQDTPRFSHLSLVENSSVQSAALHTSDIRLEQSGQITGA